MIPSSVLESSPPSSSANAAARARECLEAAGAEPGEPSEVSGAYHDPVWLIDCAWSRLRLSPLQTLVGEVIADLRDLRESDRSPADLEGGDRDPAVEALEACRAELREACAMRGADTELERYSGVIRGYASARPAAWRTAFEASFDYYRRAASHALSRALSTPVASE